jgi:hypothetical protein
MGRAERGRVGFGTVRGGRWGGNCRGSTTGGKAGGETPQPRVGGLRLGEGSEGGLFGDAGGKGRRRRGDRSAGRWLRAPSGEASGPGRLKLIGQADSGG